VHQAKLIVEGFFDPSILPAIFEVFSPWIFFVEGAAILFPF